MVGGQLYRHFNAEGELLYVGISMSALIRLAGHKYESHWYDQIAMITIENYDTISEAKEAEKVAIRSENPKYNIQFSNGYIKPKTLNLTGVAERLGISRKTMFNRIRNGKFPVPAIPDTYPRRWNVEDVDAWRFGASV